MEILNNIKTPIESMMSRPSMPSMNTSNSIQNLGSNVDMMFENLVNNPQPILNDLINKKDLTNENSAFSLLSGCVTALSNRNGDHPPSYIPTNELMNQTRQNDMILQSKNLIQAQQQQPSAQQTAAQQSIPLYRRQAGNTGSRPFNVMSEQNLQSNVQMPMKSTGTEHIDNNSLFEMFNHNGSHNEMSKKHSNLQHFQGLPPLQNLSETSNLQQQAHNLYTNSNSSIITLNHIQQPHHSNEKPNKRSNDHDEHTRQTNSLTYASVLTQGASNQQQQNQKQQQTQKNEGDPFGSIRALGPLF